MLIFFPFTQKQWAFPICRLFNSRTIAVTLFGSRKIAKPHTHDLPKGEHQHRSSESWQGLAGRTRNVFASATSACNAVLHSLLASHRLYLCSPSTNPALRFLLMASACMSFPHRELFQFVNDLLSRAIYLCLSRSPAWVKWTPDPSFHQLLISGLLSITQPGRSSQSWQTAGVTEHFSDQIYT